ncbi:MAG: alpha/beta hydrolase [Pseudomonadota bacterium]
MLKSLKFVRFGLFAAMMALPLIGAAETSAAEKSDVSVVLVHGAFSDGSAWHKVIPILQEAGVSVSAAQLPLASLESDAAVVRRLLDLQEGPVVLVGHSYGGSVITEASAHDKVDTLVYVAGFALDAGQSLTEMTKGHPPSPWKAAAIPDAAGFVRLSADGIATYFAPDLPAEEAALIAATQGPVHYKINDQAPTVAAWSMRPTFYVLTENDQIIPPKLQGFFAKRMGASVTEVQASHVAMLSQPDVVAEVILNAVAATSKD